MTHGQFRLAKREYLKTDWIRERVMLSEYSSLVHSLYELCVRVRPVEYKELALQLVKTMLHFDSAVWATGGLLDDMTVAHSMCLHNQPEEMMVNYAKYVNQDQLLQQIICSPGVTYDLYDIIPREQYIESDAYKNHCHVYGIEHAISTAVLNPISRVFSFISLYRSDPDHPFSGKDRVVKQNLAAHLVESNNINSLIYTRGQVVAAEKTGFVAQCTKEGNLLFAESGFLDLLQKEWPDWKGSGLPAEIVALLPVESCETYERKYIVIEWLVTDFGFNLLLRTRNQLDVLSARERDVAEQLHRGYSYKEIANKYGISASTVTNHVNAIYRKLEVTNKAQLVLLMEELR